MIISYITLKSWGTNIDTVSISISGIDIYACAVLPISTSLPDLVRLVQGFNQKCFRNKTIQDINITIATPFVQDH